jgi:hypothetical protein
MLRAMLSGAVTTMSSEGFSSPPRADHVSAILRSSAGGRATVSRTGISSPSSAPLKELGRKVLVAQEARQQRGQQAVLVLGPVVHAVTR